MGEIVRIPYDSFVLSAVVAELQAYRQTRVQEIRQPNEFEIILTVYGGGREGALLLSCHPEQARMHLVTRRRPSPIEPLAFQSALRARLNMARLAEVRQIDGDRIVDLIFETSEGVVRLIAELMGKHSNLILVDAGGRILGSAKSVGPAKSVRPIQLGRTYSRPPVAGTGATQSAFFRRLAVALGTAPTLGQPVLSAGSGAYPTSVAALGLSEVPKSSISLALEQHYDVDIPAREVASRRSSLLSRLQRVRAGRLSALAELGQADAAGGRAPEWQRLGELILAYGASAPVGTERLTVWDYDGTERTISLDPELDFKENAQRIFERAKHAKARLGHVRDQIQRIQLDLSTVEAMIERTEAATRLVEMEELEAAARARRYVSGAAAEAAKPKEERPYEGHRVREALGPAGWTVLYGENAEANDYLTLRVAKPNDWWLHVRGGTSAHVVIPSRNQPDRVPQEVLLFAAEIAVRHSPSKHSTWVDVDATLKKYVRKPRGAPVGTAQYSHERTLHVALKS